MYLDLNTEQLQSAVQIARSANEAITDAASLLNGVVVHNDWQCPERTEINDNTARNRSQALTLQTDAERLYGSICYAAEAFLAAEQEVVNSFNAVDGPIASFLSKTPAVSTSGIGSHAWNIAQDVLDVSNGPSKQMDVVKFETIADLLKGN